MITTQQIDELLGTTINGSDGSSLGKVGEIYLDDATKRPDWAGVSTGTIMKKHRLIPLSDAKMVGDALTVPYDMDMIKAAPEINTDDGYISPAEENKLYRHYGISMPAQGRSAPPARDRSDARAGEAMTRSEEQLKVGTEMRESGRARLRKYVVTENVTTTVPVSHEEVRVEREPITDANRDAAMSGTPISEAEHEVILHEERPVVTTQAVPVERVRVQTDKVRETEQVSGQVRKEQIELDESGEQNAAGKANQKRR
jgi:uncharacterized protein (TIGR02271 family)